MNEMNSSELRLVTGVLQKRYNKIFNKPMSSAQKKALIQKIKKHFEDDQLVIDRNDSGKLNYFILSHCAINIEFNEQFFHVAEIYCCDDKIIRRHFYARLKKLAKAAAKERGIVRMMISVPNDDEYLLQHFKKKGQLTYIELTGNVQKSLSILNKDKTVPGKLSFSTLKKSDVAPLVKLDIESHLREPTSRMREIFAKPNGKNIMKGFYRNMLKNKTCLVARSDNKLAGSVAWFIDKKNGNGLVASIFVAEQFKGRGISKALYKRMLEEFKKKKLTHYIGSSTTGRVLELAHKLKRKPGNHAFILKI